MDYMILFFSIWAGPFFILPSPPVRRFSSFKSGSFKTRTRRCCAFIHTISAVTTIGCTKKADEPGAAAVVGKAGRSHTPASGVAVVFRSLS